jgi:hypothetical protein
LYASQKDKDTKKEIMGTMAYGRVKTSARLLLELEVMKSSFLIHISG